MFVHFCKGNYLIYNFQFFKQKRCPFCFADAFCKDHPCIGSLFHAWAAFFLLFPGEYEPVIKFMHGIRELFGNSFYCSLSDMVRYAAVVRFCYSSGNGSHCVSIASQ